MKKRNLLVILLSSVALMAAPMMGCGETDDPSVNQNAGNGDTNQNAGNGDANQNAGNGDANQNTGNGDANQNAGNGDANQNTGNGDANQNAGNGGEQEACEEATFFMGQVGLDNPADFSGGVATTDPFAESAGIQEIYDRIDAMEADGGLPTDENGFLEDIVFDPPITIDGAIITATAYPGFLEKKRIWMGDKDAAIYLHRQSSANPEFDEEGVPEQPYVGQKVKFDVVSVGFYGGGVQIRDFANWEVLDEDQPVSYNVIENRDFNIEDDYYRIVRLVGKIDGEPDECGSTELCYNLVYGDNSQYSVTLRSRLNINPNTCVTYHGPVNAFPGPYDERVLGWQLDAINHQWHWRQASLD